MAKKTAKTAKPVKRRGKPATKPAKKTVAKKARQGREEVRLLLRRRQGRRQPDDEGHARRQGLRPRRDDQRRPAGAAGLHDFHRGLQPLVRRGPQAAAGHRRRDDGARARSSRRWPGSTVRRRRRNPLLVSVRSGAKFSMPGMMDTILNLGLNDEAVEGLKARTQQRPLRLRQLPPLHPDVRQRRPRDSEGEVRARVRGRQARARREGRHGPRRGRPAARSSRATRRVVKTETGKPFPQDPLRAAAAAPATPCSARGTTRARSRTAASTTSRTTSARPSTCR